MAQILKSGPLRSRPSDRSGGVADSSADIESTTDASLLAERRPTAGGGRSEVRRPGKAWSGLASLNLDDLDQTGRQKLASCDAEVDRRLEQARQQAEQAEKAAAQRGYEDGLKRAEAEIADRVAAEATQRIESSLATIRESVIQMNAAQDKYLAEYQLILGRVVVAAVSRVCRQHLAMKPATILQWASDAVASTRSAGELTVAVHPDTLGRLAAPLDEILNQADLPARTQIVPDESLALDAVQVRQPGGVVRAGLSDQIEQLCQRLSDEAGWDCDGWQQMDRPGEDSGASS